MRRNPYRRGRTESSFLKRLGSRMNLNITFKGREGRWWRRGAAALVFIVLLAVAAVMLKPETQLMNSVEISGVSERGILYVGIRDDMPAFNENGVGLETDLAVLLAQRVLPEADDPVKFLTCTSQTVSTKISDGSIDVALALLPKGKSRSYSYSYPYYSDKVRIVTLKSEFITAQPVDMVLGYVQGTPSADVLSAYKSAVTAVKEKSFFEKLFGKPDETVTVEEEKNMELKKYGSYDELLAALKRGDVDGAVMAGAYVHKYLEVYAAEYMGRTKYYLNDTVLGHVDYCIVSSSDEPAFAQLADMMIYEMQKDGTLEELLAKHGLN